MYHAIGGCGGTNVFLVGDSNIEGGESVVLSSPTPPSRPLLKQDFIHGACIQRPTKSRWVYRSAGELWVLALRHWSHSALGTVLRQLSTVWSGFLWNLSYPVTGSLLTPLKRPGPSLPVLSAQTSTMPPSGLKYATVGLTGPLNTCVRSYDIITPGSRDQHILLTKINIEKMRLVAWGRAVGVCTATNAPDTELPPSESLLRPDIRVALFETLNSIQLTFTDADRLVSQYGLQQNLANSTQQQFVRDSEDFPGNIRWCLKDQALDLLASHLHGFNNSLLALIPDRAADANRLVEAEIDSVDDVDRLQMLEDASTELNADICGMAIIRRILFKNGQLRSRADASRHSVLLQYFSGLSSVPLKDVVELAQPSHPPRRGTPQKDMVEPAEPSNPPRQGTPSDGAQTPRSFQFTPPVPTHNALEAEEPDLSSYHVVQPQDPEGYTYGQNLAPIVAALRAADKNRFIDSCNQPYRLAAEVRKARYTRSSNF